MQDKVVLVTGGAKRVGAAICRRLHAAGARLMLHYRSSAGEARLLQAELNGARPDSVSLIQADLLDLAKLPSLVDQTVLRFGRLDALVNNASAFYPTPFGATTPAQWDELFAINARAPFFLAQAAAPHLASANGAIVNIADIYAERPLRGHAVYAMGKAALLQMTRALALELAPQVRVNAVSPGAILWPENGKDPEAQSALLARTPLGRIGTPGEIAEAVRWLLQDARYCTGQVLRVDGGRMLDA